MRMNQANSAVCALGHIRDILFTELFKIVAAPESYIHRHPTAPDWSLVLNDLAWAVTALKITHVGICKTCQSH